MSKQAAGGGFGDMSALLRQAQQMQKSMSKVQDDLKERVVEDSAGGGMVKAMANGAKEVVKIEIDTKAMGIAIDDDDREMIEDLVITAVNAVLKKADEMAKKEMEKATGGLNIPGMM